LTRPGARLDCGHGTSVAFWCRTLTPIAIGGRKWLTPPYHITPPVDLRNLDPARFDVTELITELHRADVVRPIWPNGEARGLKGRGVLKRRAKRVVVISK
jgi:hypothetical protein